MPVISAAGKLATITSGGAPVGYTLQTIKSVTISTMVNRKVRITDDLIRRRFEPCTIAVTPFVGQTRNLFFGRP